MLLKFFLSLLSSWLLLLGISLSLQANELTNTPGVLESFETLINVSKQRRAQIQKKFQGKDVLTTSKQLNLDQYKYTVAHSYIQTTLLMANKSFLSQGRNQTCDFLELLWFGLYSKKPGSRFNIPASRENLQTGFKEPVLVDSKLLSEILVKDKCPESVSLFNTIRRSNIESLIKKISLPKDNEFEVNLTQCQTTYQKIKKSPYLNYLFYLSQILNYTQRNTNKTELKNKERLIFLKSAKIKEVLTYSQLNLIRGLRYNFSNLKDFCRSHISLDIFKAVKKDPFKYRNLLTPYCLDILGKRKKLTRNEYHECLDKMQSNDSICSYSTHPYTYSHYPKSPCSELIENYTSSLLKNLAPDCPARLQNEGSINAGRIISFYNKDYESADYEYFDYKNPTKCFKNNIVNMNEYSKELNIEKLWGTYACYYNKVQREENCYKVAFFDDPNNELSITQVVGKILKESKRTQHQPNCLFIPERKLKSLGLKKSQGCHITYDSNNCFFDKCAIKVFQNGREVPTFITIKNQSRIDYYAYQNNSLSIGFHRSLKQKFKLKDSKVYNLTQLEEILDRKNVLVHGIGCAEDLLPSSFKRRVINQCNPLPFIISGLKARKNALTSSVLVNLSINSIIDVKSYEWKSLNLAVENYQKNHPTRKWSLYALYK